MLLGTTADLFAAPAEGQLLNLSARAVAGEEAAALMAGFTLQGQGERPLLIRAAGPSLAAWGVDRPLTAARLELYQGSRRLAANSGWDQEPGTGSAIAQAARSASAFAFAPGSGDAALLVTLPAGVYTAVVRPRAGDINPGVALVEIYDLAPSAELQLVNLSARALVGPGAEALFAGLAIAGQDGQRLLLRGCGPALAAFGVSATLPDPQLELGRGADSLGYNDAWPRSTAASLLPLLARAVGAFALPESGADASLLATLAGGTYHLTLSDRLGRRGIGLVEIYATASVPTLPPATTFDLVGFGRLGGGITGGGAPTAPYDPIARTGNYWRIEADTVRQTGFAAQFRTALASDQPLIVELNTTIDLSQVGTPDTRLTAIAHPALFAAGKESGTIGTLALGANKTLYSANGAGGFRRGKITVSGKTNIMIRNLRFRELWEWDDATAGEYDRNDWDYLTLASIADSRGSIAARTQRIWIDHCDFEKSYDGLLDVVRGSDLVTLSWNRFAGAVSGESQRWLEQQMDYLEANLARFPYYAARRQTQSAATLLLGELAQKKGNLVGNGATDLNRQQDSGYLNLTLHHNAYVAVDQRMPRLRFGNAHVFGLLVDDTLIRNLSGLSLFGVAATSEGAVFVEDSLLLDVRTPLVLAAGTEPLGRIAVRNVLNLESTTLTDRGFDPALATPLSSWRWNPPAAATGLAPWPYTDPTRLPDGYYPAGRSAADYRTPPALLREPLASGGVILPASSLEMTRLRHYLVRTSPSQEP